MSFVYHFEQNKFLSKLESDKTLDQITLGLPIGLYTTFRTFRSGKYTIGLADHLLRLTEDAAEAEWIRSMIRSVVVKCQYSESKIRVHKVPGSRSELFILIEKFDEITADQREKGIVVDLSTIKRENPLMKSTSFIGQSQEKRSENRSSGIYESMIVVNGKIREGFTSNFFYVINDVLMTAKLNILKGVTRGNILKLAEAEKIKVGYRALSVEQLPHLKEAFICSSSRGVIHIAQIIADPSYQLEYGEITKRLERAYQENQSSLLELI